MITKLRQDAKGTVFDLKIFSAAPGVPRRPLR